MVLIRGVLLRLFTEDLDPEEKRRREEEDRKREAARLAKDPGRSGKTWKDLET